MAIDHIINFQRRYKINRIKRVLALFNDNIKKIKFDDYHDLTNNIKDVNLLRLTNILLFRVNRYLNPESKSISKKQSRIFLTAFILKHHPNQVFTTVNKNYRSQISAIANDLIEYIQNDFLKNDSYKNYSLNKFGHIFNTYFVNYNELLKIDKLGLINELILEYYNTQITIDKINNSNKYDYQQKEESIKSLVKHQNQIKSEINLLEPNNNIVDNLENYVQKINFVKNKYDDEIIENLRNDLNENNYDLIMNIFSDINDMTKININLEEIKTKLENDDLEYDFFYLCSDIYDDLELQFDEDLLINNVEFNEVIILFVKDFYRKLDNKICHGLIDSNIFN